MKASLIQFLLALLAILLAIDGQKTAAAVYGCGAFVIWALRRDEP